MEGRRRSVRRDGGGAAPNDARQHSLMPLAVRADDAVHAAMKAFDHMLVVEVGTATMGDLTTTVVA
jgi:hypothetical protein